MIKTIKKLWRYIKKYKMLFISSIVLMLLVQFLALVQPLIVKSIMDDYLVGIENPWYETVETKNSVSYNGKYYSQDGSGDGGMIVIIRTDYYFMDEIIDKDFVTGNKEVLVVGFLNLILNIPVSSSTKTFLLQVTRKF